MELMVSGASGSGGSGGGGSGGVPPNEQASGRGHAAESPVDVVVPSESADVIPTVSPPPPSSHMEGNGSSVQWPEVSATGGIGVNTVGARQRQTTTVPQSIASSPRGNSSPPAVSSSAVSSSSSSVTGAPAHADRKRRRAPSPSPPTSPGAAGVEVEVGVGGHSAAMPGLVSLLPPVPAAHTLPGRRNVKKRLTASSGSAGRRTAAVSRRRAAASVERHQDGETDEGTENARSALYDDYESVDPNNDINSDEGGNRVVVVVTASEGSSLNGVANESSSLSNSPPDESLREKVRPDTESRHRFPAATRVERKRVERRRGTVGDASERRPTAITRRRRGGGGGRARRGRIVAASRIIQDDVIDDDDGGGDDGDKVMAGGGGVADSDDEEEEDDEDDDDEYLQSRSGSDGEGDGREENESTCYECRGGGSLICCDGCTRSYHTECVPTGDKPREQPEEWYCPECKRKSGADASLLKRGYYAPDTTRRRMSPPPSSLSASVTPGGTRGDSMSENETAPTRGARNGSESGAGSIDRAGTGLSKGQRTLSTGAGLVASVAKKTSVVGYLVGGGMGGDSGLGGAVSLGPRRKGSPTTKGPQQQQQLSAQQDGDTSPELLTVAGRPRRGAVKAGKRTSEGNTTNSKINIGPQYQTPAVPRNFLEAMEYGMNYGAFEAAMRYRRLAVSSRIGIGLNECRLLYSPSLWERKTLERVQPSEIIAAVARDDAQSAAHGTATAGNEQATIRRASHKNGKSPASESEVQLREAAAEQESAVGSTSDSGESSATAVPVSDRPQSEETSQSPPSTTMSPAVSVCGAPTTSTTSPPAPQHSSGDESHVAAGGTDTAAEQQPQQESQQHQEQTEVKSTTSILRARRVFVRNELEAYLDECRRFWPEGLQWQFSSEFALKLLHSADYSPQRALRMLRDPHLNFQEACDPPLRPYMNKWRPRDKRGQMASVPFPPMHCHPRFRHYQSSR